MGEMIGPVVRDPWTYADRMRQVVERDDALGGGKSDLSLETARSLNAFFERNWPHTSAGDCGEEAGLLDDIKFTLDQARYTSYPVRYELPQKDVLEERLKNADLPRATQQNVQVALEEAFEEQRPDGEQLFVVVADAINQTLHPSLVDRPRVLANLALGTVWDITDHSEPVQFAVNVAAERFAAVA